MAAEFYRVRLEQMLLTSDLTQGHLPESPLGGQMQESQVLRRLLSCGGATKELVYTGYQLL